MVRFIVDGHVAEALQGDTVLTALLMNGRKLRRFEFDEESRAGFCLIGACQDCWTELADGKRVRACTTSIEPGMAVITEATDNA
ncbi:MAG: (2Fe-2S)-binding protein [Rhodospirillales bacterium]|nr:(2Fe-2S)-binding protein [Rhodospirillales bacterium]